jgi:hypothetical protein
MVKVPTREEIIQALKIVEVQPKLDRLGRPLKQTDGSYGALKRGVVAPPVRVNTGRPREYERRIKR